MIAGFHSWWNKLLLGVNQHPSVDNGTLSLMWFLPEPQQRRARSFKARCFHYSAKETPPAKCNMLKGRCACVSVSVSVCTCICICACMYVFSEVKATYRTYPWLSLEKQQHPLTVPSSCKMPLCLTREWP